MMYTMRRFSPEQGDVKLAWSDEQVEMMTEVISKKMAEGFSFFFVDDDGREVRLRQIGDLKGRNNVIIGDQEADLLIRQGKIGIVEVNAMIADDDAKDESAPIVTRGRAKTARAAATANTVAVAPAGGG